MKKTGRLRVSRDLKNEKEWLFESKPRLKNEKYWPLEVSPDENERNLPLEISPDKKMKRTGR